MAKTTTAKIRSALALALERCVKGELDSTDGRNLIGLANQISNSMATEVKVMTMQMKAGHAVEKFGSLEVDG